MTYRNNRNLKKCIPPTREANVMIGARRRKQLLDLCRKHHRTGKPLPAASKLAQDWGWPDDVSVFRHLRILRQRQVIVTEKRWHAKRRLWTVVVVGVRA